MWIYGPAPTLRLSVQRAFIFDRASLVEIGCIDSVVVFYGLDECCDLYCINSLGLPIYLIVNTLFYYHFKKKDYFVEALECAGR